MKRFIFAIILFAFNIPVFCQNTKSHFEKPPVDSATFGNWPSVTKASISNNGEFVSYRVKDPARMHDKIIIKSLNSNWQFEQYGFECQFSGDNKKAILKNSGDSLCIIDLGENNVEYIPNVESFKIPDNEESHLAFVIKNQRRLIAKDIIQTVYIDSADDYYYSSDGKALFIKTAETNNTLKFTSLVHVDLTTYKQKIIWSSHWTFSNIISIVFPKNGNCLAFFVEEEMGLKSEQSIWYYDSSKLKASKVIDNSALSQMGLVINGLEYNGLTNNGKRIFVRLMKKEFHKPKVDMVKVDVWSYTDSKLQSQQLGEIEPRAFAAVIGVEDQAIYLIENEDENIIAKNENYAVVARCNGADNEWNWNKASRSTIYLVSLKDGSRVLINENVKGYLHNIQSSYFLMPREKYVIYYNPEKGNYFSYEITSGIKRNISANIEARWTTYVKRDVPMAKYMPLGFAGSIKDDEGVLIYDQCDIYLIDPLNRNKPLNLTNGFGKENNIEFRIALENQKLFCADEKVIISAFNRVNKKDGFYSIRINEASTPVVLTTQEKVFKGTWEDDRFIPVLPIKAKKAEVYILRAMSAKDSPNFFWTTDFRTYNQISNVYPEKIFNWLTTELVTWEAPNKSLCQGILYKPENFDQKRKYPLIFYYYENLSEGLNDFLRPEFTRGSLNIPYYVSNGYLVFTPDIHYKIGAPGRSVVNTVISAARYLSKLPFVDSTKLGIQGHSRGGWETNFLITQTNIFAAAMSAAGFCNYVGLYNGTRFPSFGGMSRQSSFELGFQRIGKTIWESPKLYIENSPIFFAHQVKTPLLMMNNKADQDIPFEQGVEFFTALRRLSKRVWMLQYDEDDHIVFGKPAEDLEIRMKQFFDHYLNEAKAPEWMTKGIPASMKGVETGYQLDSLGRCSINCKICRKVN